MDLDPADVENSITSFYSIAWVRRGLNYQLAGMGVWGSSFLIIPWFYVFALAAIASVIFIPFLITALIQEKRYGWLLSLALCIILPPLLAYVTLTDLTWTWVSSLIALGSFYVYCAILRIAIREW